MRKARVPQGYWNQSERFQKQRRLQQLRAELARAQADRDQNRVRVTDGTKRLANARHNLDAGGPEFGPMAGEVELCPIPNPGERIRG